MLQKLSISNYALISNVSIDFKKHFTVITGETGTTYAIRGSDLGKTIKAVVNNFESAATSAIGPAAYAYSTGEQFTSHTFTLCSCILSPNISAYLVGCKGMNGAPKQAEKVVCGSVIPASVPATFAVYPEMK